MNRVSIFFFIIINITIFIIIFTCYKHVNMQSSVYKFVKVLDVSFAMSCVKCRHLFLDLAETLRCRLSVLRFYYASYMPTYGQSTMHDGVGKQCLFYPCDH